MNGDDHPVWDQDDEKYEDFLERIPKHLAAKLADGTAYMAQPLDGFDVMKVYVESAREENDLKAWNEYVESLETEDAAKQVVSDIAALEVVAAAMANSVLRRRSEIHLAGCDKCQDIKDGKSKKGKTMKRALDAARDAFLEAMDGEGEEEDWQENADPNAWKDKA